MPVSADATAPQAVAFGGQETANCITLVTTFGIAKSQLLRNCPHLSLRLIVKESRIIFYDNTLRTFFHNGGVI